MWYLKNCQIAEYFVSYKISWGVFLVFPKVFGNEQLWLTSVLRFSPLFFYHRNEKSCRGTLLYFQTFLVEIFSAKEGVSRFSVEFFFVSQYRKFP